MARPKAPDILRPDLQNDFYKKLSTASEKLNKFVEQPYKQVLRNHNWEPVFSYVKYTTAPKLGYVVVQFFNNDEARIGYIISVSQTSLDVILNNDKFREIRQYPYTYNYIDKTHTFNNPSYTRPLMISQMSVDEFVEFVDEKVYEERHLDKRAKITNRELRQMREDIFLLKHNLKNSEWIIIKKIIMNVTIRP